MDNDFKMKEGYEPIEFLGEESGKESPAPSENRDDNLENTNNNDESVESPSNEVPTEELENEGDNNNEIVSENENNNSESENSDVSNTDEAPTEEVVEPKRSLKEEDISEFTDGNFKTIDELNEAYNSLNNKVAGKTIMESLNSQVEDQYGEGVTFSDLVEIKNTRFDEMSSFDLIEQNLLFDDPEISDDEINAELIQFDLMTVPHDEIKRRIDDEEDPLTQREYDVVKAKMTRRARSAKNKLMEYQDSIDLDGFEFHTPKHNEANQQDQRSQEDIDAELKYYSSVINNLNEMKVSVGTDESPLDVNIKVTDEDRNGIEDFLRVDNGKNFIAKRWIKEDGKVDIETLSSDVYKIFNFDKSVKLGFTQGKSAGVKDEVKNIDNIDLNSKTGSRSGSGKTNNVHSDIAREINNEQS